MAPSEQHEPPRKRFSRSGHTSHAGRNSGTPPPSPAAQSAPPQYGPPPNYGPPAHYGPPPPYGQPQHGPPQYGPPTAPHTDPAFGSPTYHQSVPPTPDNGRVVGAAKAAAVGTQHAAQFVTRKVISASQANGAGESGLSALIWNQVLSYGTDAMITVALASTVFFGASTHAQRGNVLLYLLVTMAPFALVAPVIGPALDRLQHGRRWAMGGTAIGRAILAIIMAGHPTDLLVLYPCALGSLVLSKAYSVVRAAAAPRLVPPNMTLVEANARLSMFGLAAAIAGGAFVGIVIKATGSYSVGLWVTAIAFGVCAFFAFRLPPQVDSAAPAPRHPGEPARPRVQLWVPSVARLREWAKRGFGPQVITSLQGESALRFLAGLLTIFLAFWVESTRHGVEAAVALGAVVGAAGVGNFVGTALGARLKLSRPEIVIMFCVSTAAGVCLLSAILFTIDVAVVGMLLSASCNALSKIALDAVIQRDVDETLRSSAFARSETFLQLSWVLGAALGCLLPSDDGSLGFWVAGGVVGIVAVVVVLRNRVTSRTPSAHVPPQSPGTVNGPPPYSSPGPPPQSNSGPPPYSSPGPPPYRPDPPY